VLDYQGRSYANLYLDRLKPVVVLDNAAHLWTLTAETARLLALRMSYEDIIRVADLKTRAERSARVRAEVKAKPGEPVVTTEFLKPGLEEMTAMLPPSIGRRLMQAAQQRAAAAESIRLLQDSFNTASLALYTSLGFDVAEQVALVAGVPAGPASGDVEVRALLAADLDACEQLHVAVHGFERTAELRDALETPGLTPVVAHRDDRLVAYATTFTDFGLAYAVAESQDDLFALIAGAVSPDRSPASFLLPLHQHALVRRCLAAGLQIVKPMTYLVAGPYRRPQGAWIPSVLY
jgi:hypothetical protein